MESVLLAFVVCASNVFCFVLGMRVANGKGEKIIPPLIPKAIEAKKESKLEQERLNVILENIENFDGTPVGQKDVPWR